MIYERRGSVYEPTINQKLEWIHCAIQEAQSGDDSWLDHALELVEDLRECSDDGESGQTVNLVPLAE